MSSGTPAVLDNLPFAIDAVVAEHEGAHRTALHAGPVVGDAAASISAAAANWRLQLAEEPIDPRSSRLEVRAALRGGPARQAAYGIRFTDTDWTTDNYVLLPGAVYAGNRFNAQAYPYSPPPLGPKPEDADQTLWTNDLPRLSRKGPSHLDQMSIDCAVPGMAVFFPKRRKALLLFTPQETGLGPVGLEIIESEQRDRAELLVMSPGLRHDRYFSISGYLDPSEDRAADLPANASTSLPFQLHWLECGTVTELFALLFDRRKACFPDQAPLKNELPFSTAWERLHRKHNRENWREDLDLFQINLHNEPPAPAGLFQMGWCGGGITTLPMLQEGDARSQERALRNIDFIFSGQTGAGLFHPLYDGKHWRGTLKAESPAPGQARVEVERPWTLSRREADALYFLTRQFFLLHERGQADAIRPHWEAGLRHHYEAILDIWERHEGFGQYLHLETGEVVIAGSTSAALMPAALILAGRYFDDPRGLEAAQALGTTFAEKDLAQGLTTGAPGDCMQAPDSESVAALLESFVQLFETTGEERWQQAALDAFHQLASWALCYDYRFPEGSALHQIGAQSRGAYLANAQNKTGVPGICTLSGEGILRLYRACGDSRLLDFLRETTHTMTQYLSRTDKPIPTRLTWGRKGLTELPEDWICERINVTQWGEAIGEQAAYSCWCEAALMLTWTDLPGLYWDRESDRVTVFDHVTAQVRGGHLELQNPTAFDCRVKILAESAADRANPFPVNPGHRFPQVDLPAGATRIWQLGNSS